MTSFAAFDDERRRQIYDYVERQGAVDPERVRRNVLVQPPSSSKPARSGAELDPSVPMSAETFAEHVAVLERDGYLEERGGKLRVARPVQDDSTTVEFEELGDADSDEDDSDEIGGEETGGENDEGRTAVVRPAREEDFAGIVDVVDTIATEGNYVVAARLANDVAREEVLFRRNESENRVFFVATVDDDAVGWLHVEAVQSPMMDHTAELTVGVLEEYRGNGIGSTLMERGLAWARENDLRKVYQTLPATNDRGIAFLENQDWAVESTRRGHYQIGDELVDEVQLAIWLDD